MDIVFLVPIYIYIKSGALLGFRLCGWSQFQLPTTKGQKALSSDPQWLLKHKPPDLARGKHPEQTVTSELYCSQFQFLVSILCRIYLFSV